MSELRRRLFLSFLASAGMTSYAVAWRLATDARSAVPASDQRLDAASHARAATAAEVRARFDQAVVMLHAKQYEHAATALHRVLELEPNLPEAHVNMGYAMIGLQRFAAARDFFQSAVALRTTQANAYHGLAMAYEGLADFEAALGAMRTYVHLAPSDDAHMRRARAAIWEWEQKLAQSRRQNASSGKGAS